MITFRVVKEELGWGIRMGEISTTLFGSKDLAVREANLLAEAICRHGEPVQVAIEDDEPVQRPRPVDDAAPIRPEPRSFGR
jgi:hypothetical protein